MELELGHGAVLDIGVGAAEVGLHELRGLAQPDEPVDGGLDGRAVVGLGRAVLVVVAAHPIGEGAAAAGARQVRDVLALVLGVERRQGRDLVGGRGRGEVLDLVARL